MSTEARDATLCCLSLIRPLALHVRVAWAKSGLPQARIDYVTEETDIGPMVVGATVDEATEKALASFIDQAAQGIWELVEAHRVAYLTMPPEFLEGVDRANAKSGEYMEAARVGNQVCVSYHEAAVLLAAETIRLFSPNAPVAGPRDALLHSGRGCLKTDGDAFAAFQETLRCGSAASTYDAWSTLVARLQDWPDADIERLVVGVRREWANLTTDPAPAAGDGATIPPKPRWDGDRRELWLGETLCRQFRQPAANQETVLAKFQAEGWPARIDNPLPYGGKQLGDAISMFNARAAGIVLRRSGDNGILWEPVENR